MIWFNYNKTKMINLDLIEGYQFEDKIHNTNAQSIAPKLTLYFTNRYDILYSSEAIQVFDALKKHYENN